MWNWTTKYDRTLKWQELAIAKLRYKFDIEFNRYIDGEITLDELRKNIRVWWMTRAWAITVFRKHFLGSIYATKEEKFSDKNIKIKKR